MIHRILQLFFLLYNRIILYIIQYDMLVLIQSLCSLHAKAWNRMQGIVVTIMLSQSIPNCSNYLGLLFNGGKFSNSKQF
jgi:hypothetical protein